MRARMGGRGRVGLLLSTSVAALLIGGGAPAAFAPCSTRYTHTTAPGCTNATTITGIAVNNSTITGNVNNVGTISPNGIFVSNSSLITGQIFNAGTIATAGPTGIRVDTNSIVTNGIVNQGLIQATGAGIVVDGG